MCIYYIQCTIKGKKKDYINLVNGGEHLLQPRSRWSFNIHIHSSLCRVQCIIVIFLRYLGKPLLTSASGDA